MATAKRIPSTMTTAEFLAWPGDGQDGRYQLIDGELVAMSPAATGHNTIQTNVAYELTRHLNDRDSPCRAMVEPAISTRIRANMNVRVPDVAVSCAPDEVGQVLLPDPILLVEVLSPGNARGTWDNVWAYTTIPSLQEILVIHSVEIKAEFLRRASDGTWPETPEILLQTDSLKFESIGLILPLLKCYRRTKLADSLT